MWSTFMALMRRKWTRREKLRVFGMAIVLLAAMMFVASLFIDVRCFRIAAERTNRIVSLVSGSIEIIWNVPPHDADSYVSTTMKPPYWEVLWDGHPETLGTLSLSTLSWNHQRVPVWVPLLLIVMLIACLWCPIRPRKTGCKKCGYPLTGLPPASPCPECGAPNTVPLPAP